ncbi:MAG: hypothetical protein V3T72_07755 [Thermoanaerobaculia bacterium]
MAPRTLKETYARKQSSEFVESAVAVHGGGVADTLAEKLGAEMREGEEMPDVSFYFELMARRMGRYRADLAAASQAHLDELAAADEFRALREEAMAELTPAYIAARHTVTSGYSAQDAAAFGFESNVATVPAAMELQIEHLLANFAKPEVQLSEPLYPSVKFDPAEGEATFLPLLDRLKAARAGIDEGRRRSEATLLAKNDAVVANDLEFGQISRCVEANFALGGRTDLAKRVRPSARRPGRRQEVEDDPSPSPEDEASEEAATDPNPAAAGDGEAVTSDPTIPATAETTEEDSADEVI